MSNHHREVLAKTRFEFGKNWRKFLESFDERRLSLALDSLQTMVEGPISGKRFLDVGCGSGLFSLAARKMGAKVHSFDYDPDSVHCAESLKTRFFPNDENWSVSQASVLDASEMANLGHFDIVYAWGVLHHTGRMWSGTANCASLVVPGGTFFLALYNDQGGWSRRWLRIKHIYNRLPQWLRVPFVLLVMVPRELTFMAKALCSFRLMGHIRAIRDYHGTSLRGMSFWHDWIDWVGGYPFECAKPEEVLSFLVERGFALRRLRTCGGGIGCNEYVFVKL